eukprot:6191475-Pleurochrysis_carterae.AAC.2
MARPTVGLLAQVNRDVEAGEEGAEALAAESRCSISGITSFMSKLNTGKANSCWPACLAAWLRRLVEYCACSAFTLDLAMRSSSALAAVHLASVA